MDKLLLFPGRNEQSVFTYVIDAEKNYLEKTAAQYHPTIAAYINGAKPIKGKTQILLTALGAGEWWGTNVNGDYFPETALAYEGPEYGYKTFESMAKIYKHHVNKDPAASYGDVPLSVYNPQFHRVELIVMLDNAKAPDIVDRIEAGDYPDWSMGCRVPYDICSICGNKAPTRKQYCEHARYLLGRIHPETGKQVYVINTMPKFFDISQVLIGADKIAKTHMKVASARAGIALPSSALLAEKMAAGDKKAAIEKEIPSDAPPASQESLKEMARGIMAVQEREAPLPRPLLNRLGALPFPQVMSTLAMLGILPKPQEFQRIVIIGMGKQAMADELDRQGICFDPTSVGEMTEKQASAYPLGADYFDQKIAEMLLPYMAERSYYATHLAARVAAFEKGAAQHSLPTFVKISQDNQGTTKERKPVDMKAMLALAAGLYALQASKAPASAVKGIDALIAKHPWLAAAVGLTLASTFLPAMKPTARGNFVEGEKKVDPDTNDVFSRMERERNKPFLKVAAVGKLLHFAKKPAELIAKSPAASRLALGIPMAYMGSGMLHAHKELNPHDEEGRIKSFFRQNPDVVAGALAADAVLSLRGKGTHGLISRFAKAAAAAEEVVGPSPILKAASASEFLTGPVVQALAMGRAGGLPGRIVGGLFDQAVIETASRIGQKKEPKTQGRS